MKRLSQEQVYERYAQLPEAVKDAVFAEATADKMLEIATKYGLLVTAVGALAELTGYVMVGLLHPNDFVKELASELSVPEEKARAIAEDVNQHIFKPIREHLMALHKITEETASPTPLKKTFVPTFSAPMIFPKKDAAPTVVLDPRNELPSPTPPTPQDTKGPIFRPPTYDVADPYHEPVE